MSAQPNIPEPHVRILVVDDSLEKRMALAAALSPLGYEIVEADSGVAALRCVMANDFAVILLDVCMPVMDGFETAAFIRLRSQSELTPIIFITSHANDEIVRTDHYAAGAVDFIFAPVPPADLRAKVAAFAKLYIRSEHLAARVQEAQATVDSFPASVDEDTTRSFYVVPGDAPGCRPAAIVVAAPLVEVVDDADDPAEVDAPYALLVLPHGSCS